jgi:hypothetical protein
MLLSPALSSLYPSSSASVSNAPPTSSLFQEASDGNESLGILQRVTNAILGASAGGTYAVLGQNGGDISGAHIVLSAFGS